MRPIAAKFVLRLLGDEEKTLFIGVCWELMGQIRDDASFIYKVINGDQSCVSGYDPETVKSGSHPGASCETSNAPRLQEAPALV